MCDERQRGRGGAGKRLPPKPLLPLYGFVSPVGPAERTPDGGCRRDSVSRAVAERLDLA